MTNANGYEVLKIILLGGFAGFAIFCVSYALVVWSRRNKSVAASKHLLATVWPLLAVIGFASLLYGVVQAKLVTYTGLIDGDTFDRSNLESRARLGALSSVPLKIDPALTQRQNQLRAQIDQFSHFRFELEKAHREFTRDFTKLHSDYAREISAIKAELQVAETSLAGYPERLTVAERQLKRATELVRLGSWSEAVADQRRMEILALKDSAERATATVTAANKRAESATEKYEQAAQLYKIQIEGIDQRSKEYTDELEAQQKQLLIVERLIAEDGEKALNAMSSGKGFVVKVVVPTAELAAIEQAKVVTFQPNNAPIRSRFNGTVREAKQLEASPSETIVSFDVRLPSDVLAQLKVSSEPLLVNVYWHPSIVQSSLVHAGLGIIAVALLVWLLGTARTNEHKTPALVSIPSANERSMRIAS